MHGIASERLGQEEWVIGEAEQQGSLFHDLKDRVLDGWRGAVGQRVEVKGDDSNSVRKLFWNHDWAMELAEEKIFHVPTYLRAE